MSCDTNPVGTWTYTFVKFFSSGSDQFLEPGSETLSNRFQSLQSDYDEIINSNTLLYAQIATEEEEADLETIQAMQNFYIQLSKTNSELYLEQLKVENIEIFGAYALFFIIFIYCLLL